jgi:hypothetical protein
MTAASQFTGRTLAVARAASEARRAVPAPSFHTHAVQSFVDDRSPGRFAAALDTSALAEVCACET